MPHADPVREGIPCMLMRGGTSKGAFFLAEDLPTDDTERDDLLLRVMGSPDARQIDGLGGGHPLTSKVAVVSPSEHPDAELDYLFLQVVVDEPRVVAAQTCGNMLAAVGPFALERGLVAATDPETSVRIRLVNTGDIATARFGTRGGQLDPDGVAVIDGVPGKACPIDLRVAAPADKPLLPTGAVAEEIDGVRVTLIDNGMPVVLVAAADLGVEGTESPDDLESRADLAARVAALRLIAGERMGLGDVSEQTVPKVILLAPPHEEGAITTRAFIPIRVHTSLGVLMAASVAAGVHIPGAVGHDLARLGDEDAPTIIEHPAGMMRAEVRVWHDERTGWRASSLSMRTARKIFDGRVFPRPRP